MGKIKQKDSEKKEKPYNKLQWFLFAVVIPIFFTIFIVLIIFTVAGVNVFQWTKEVGSKVPIISTLIEDDNSESESKYQKRIVELEGGIKDSEAQMAKLESIIESKDKEIQNADLEKQRLEEEINELRAVQGDNKREFKDIIRTYETMAPKKAAPILSAMKDEEAVKILSSVKADTLAQILEKMEPETAARLTQKLTVQSEKNRAS